MDASTGDLGWGEHYHLWAAAAAFGCALFFVVMLYFNPFTQGLPLSDALEWPTVKVLVIQSLAILVAVLKRPVLMYIVFTLYFFPMGFYLFGTIGGMPSALCSIAYLGLAIAIHVRQRRLRALGKA